MISKKQVKDILQAIPDPEIGISIWDLGLIYEVSVDDKKGYVRILMTLTSLGCPLFEQIETPIRHGVGKLKGVKTIDVDLTFEPPWSMDRMSDEGKAKMGFL